MADTPPAEDTPSNDNLTPPEPKPLSARLQRALEKPSDFELPDKKNLSKMDMAILTLKRTHPNLSGYAIGKKLKELGVSHSRMSVYSRLTKNDYLKAEFKQLENYHRETLVREDFPLARKTLRKVLKNKDKSVPAAVQVQASKIIYDKALADRQDKHPESPVNIENVERLQVLIQGDIKASIE